jgi:hypothetical protein
MQSPRELIFSLAIAAQKIEKIRESARLWRVRGINSSGIVPIEVLSIESKSEDVLERLKVIYSLIEKIRKERGEIPYTLDDT